MTTRKTGQRKTDLSGEPIAEVIKKAKSLIRSDYGGQNPQETIKKILKDHGVDAGPKSLDAIKELVEKQIEGCRKRAFPRMDEAIRRTQLLDREVMN